MKNKTTHIILPVVSVVCLTALLIAWWVFRSVRNMDAMITDTQIKIANADASVDQFATLQKIAKETEKDRIALTDTVLSNDGVADFASFIESLGSRVGGKVTLRMTNSPNPSNASNPYKTDYLNMNISVEGSWSALMKFLVLMENLPYASKIDSVVFSTTPPANGKGRSLWLGAMNIRVLKSIN